MKKALIVDDNEQNLYLLQTMLKGQGYDVVTAGNGVEALEQARLIPPDIVISDILMPVMDGFALCRRWQKDESLKNIPFVFYTATYTDPKDEDFALSLGAARFVVKPQDPEAFMALIRQVINEYEAGPPVEPAQEAPIATDYYKLYSEALVRKLEDKMLELEQLNRGLEQEITERMRAEEILKASEQKHRALFESSRDAIMTLAPPSWCFTTGNPATVEMFSTGDEAAFTALGPWELSPEYQPDGRLSSEKAAEMIQTAMAKGSHFFEWTHQRLGGELFPATVLLTRMEIGGQALLQATVRDVTQRRRAEEQLQQTLESLRNAVSVTIQIMTSTVEARDPYTAGHQLRSADLARSIATEMGLPQEKIDAIRMAGSIHDIGKISIPAEILSKPTRLSEIEFSLIKEHSRSGYEILKSVESPWNLAEIAYQHHERMDGSGYPRHLKGEEILIEARILAIADTVEAMASHRPYRPGLGINAALEEIEKNKGIIYDADAVDVCLRLFREKRYELAQ